MMARSTRRRGQRQAREHVDEPDEKTADAGADDVADATEHRRSESDDAEPVTRCSTG